MELIGELAQKTEAHRFCDCLLNTGDWLWISALSRGGIANTLLCCAKK
ncbi:hypothetical protein PVK62_02990 [Aliivibrio sp. S3MY1]|nr:MULTISPECIES: hypothetical protein [unclassified Aliivibrio]MDD9194800.1 hypothetical protein [Aliivibrio sp. S3MY1]MDD9198659.1 hypothetical protein [Aliivibrio sp. S2MY1]